MNFENMNLFRGFDLFFDDIAEEELKAICKSLGGEVDYSALQKKVTYMCQKKVIIENIKISDFQKIVSSIGKRYASELNCKFLYSELYLRRHRRSTQHWFLPDVEIVSVTYQSQPY
jgi:hypothetical protein